jgi:hypothetical protein
LQVLSDLARSGTTTDKLWNTVHIQDGASCKGNESTAPYLPLLQNSKVLSTNILTGSSMQSRIPMCSEPKPESTASILC